MVKQKAIFTTQTDFKSLGYVGTKKINPYLYFDGSNMPTDVSPTPSQWGNPIAFNSGGLSPVSGVRGKANKFNNNALAWRNWVNPAISQLSVSFWVKVPASNLSGWTILFTARGDGWGDHGVHLALYNNELDARIYGDGASLDVYSTDPNQSGKTFEADKWYHVALTYNRNVGINNFQVHVNGEQWISSQFGGIVSAKEYSWTIGDIVDGNTFAGSYPFYGTIDDLIVCINEDAWTVEECLDYYNKVSNGEFLDDWTIPDSIRLSNENLQAAYPTTNPVSWYSPTLDLGGNGFVDFGYIEAVGQIPSAATSMTFFTRTSADGETWEEWRQVDVDGRFLSTNQRYVQVRVDLATTDGLLTPQLDEIRIMEDLNPIPLPDLPNTLVRSDDPLTLYRDLDSGLSSMGVLKNAYDIFIEEEINGEDTLTFKLPVKDKKRKEIGEDPVEMVVNIGERYYVVKEVLDKRDDDGKLYSQFTCEARWTELRDWYVDGIELVEVSAEVALQTIVANVFREEGDPEFDWTIGRVEIDKKRTLRSEWADVLSLVREVQNTWGGEVLFDTKNKVIHLVVQVGKNSGVRFYFNKNLKNIERVIDTYNLVTRIYPTGKGDLDIKTVNNGKPYIENLTWVNKLNLRRKIIPYKWKDERYTVPQNLLDDGQAMLDEMAKPNVAYKTTVHDLSTLTGHEHEYFELGDIVSAVDKELFDEEIINRVVRRKQDVRKPENTEVELSQPIKTLADIQSRALDDQIQTLIGSDPLSTTDVQQMTVFNNLLNSRGDDGLTSWVHTANGTQFELVNAGFSGSWSFKVQPDYDVDAQLTQTVDGVSHRSSYTVSAAVATEGDITRGSSKDAFVGIKVLVYYEGETTPQVHYLAVPDVTTNENGGEQIG